MDGAAAATSGLVAAAHDPGGRLVFSGASCAKCGQLCDHPAIRDLTAVPEAVRKAVDAILRQRLGPDEDLDAARRASAFYLCSACGDPFYGGTVVCADEAGPNSLPPEERMCPACVVARLAPSTDTGGDGDVRARAARAGTPCVDPAHAPHHLWKCRLCCRTATRVCFGRTHFCEPCHDRLSARAGGTARLPPAIPCVGRSACGQPLPAGAEGGGETHRNGAEPVCEQLLACGACLSHSAGGATAAPPAGGASRNLVVNPAAANGMVGWVSLSRSASHWSTERADLPPASSTTRTNWVSTYYTCVMAQVVDLRASVRHPGTAAVSVSAAFAARSDCESWYQLDAALHDERGRMVASASTGEMTAPADCWERTGVVVGPHPTARYALVCLAGADRRFWAGRYGSKVTDVELTTPSPVGRPTAARRRRAPPLEPGAGVMLSRVTAVRHLLRGGVPACRSAAPPPAVTVAAAALVAGTGSWLPGAAVRGGATRGLSAVLPPASPTAAAVKGVPSATATVEAKAETVAKTPPPASAAAAEYSPSPPPLPVPDARRAVVSLAGTDASLVTASATALSHVADAVAELTARRSPLAGSLSTGGGPGAAADLALLRAEVARLTNGVFLLVTVGEWNAGKSALLNVLLGGALLPSGPTPTTAEVTVVQHAGGVAGRPDGGGGGAAAAATAGGSDPPPSINAPVTAGTDHTGEAVKLALHAPWLSHVQLVDTPGTNALDREHEARTRAFVPLADLVLFVTSAERPFSESERAFLASIRAWGKAVVVVLNKVDLLDAEPGSLETVVAYVTDRARVLLGASPRVFPLSARAALAAKQAAASGDDAAAAKLWASSRFGDFEAFVTTTLDSRERLALKLDASAGVGEALYRRYSAAVEAAAGVAAADAAAVAAVNEVLATAAADVDRATAGHVDRVDNLLLRMLTRSDNFFSTHVVLGNVRQLAAGAVATAYEREVVGTTAAEVGAATAAFGEWLASREAAAWAEVRRVFARRAADTAAGSGGGEADATATAAAAAALAAIDASWAAGLVGGGGRGGSGTVFSPDGSPPFVPPPDQRRASLAALTDASSPFAADYAAAVSPTRVGESVAAAVAATGAVGLGALGALGVLASASALDASGATGLATAAGAGLLVLPHRRRALRAGTRSRVEALRVELAAATRTRVADGKARHASAVRTAVAAFAADTAARTAAVRTHGEALARAGEELAAVRARVGRSGGGGVGGKGAAPPPPPTSVGKGGGETPAGVRV
ncbi:hypothetical protein MMPV_004997 [Pyropia vietnamensis]